MKKWLYFMVVYGVVMCAISMISAWVLYDYYAAGFVFCAILGMIGIFEAFRSLDNIRDSDEDEGIDE